MRPLSDAALRRLRLAVAEPDLTGTRYELMRRLGTGGMGAVYLARDAVLDREVAIKVLHLDDEASGRMIREARTIAGLEHPNIIPVYDSGELPDGRFYYVMKYVQGVRLDAFRRNPPPLRDRLRLFSMLCEAVAFAHSRGVIHRDLKPENIMVGPFGEVLIMDWGLAKGFDDSEPPGVVAGTPHYMAPEQARGDSQIDARADIFALGRILTFLCDSPAPKPVRSIAEKAQANDPGARFQTAEELARDVLHYLDGLPVSAHPETPWESTARWYRNNQTLLLLIAAYAGARFLIFFWTRR